MAASTTGEPKAEVSKVGDLIAGASTVRALKVEEPKEVASRVEGLKGEAWSRDIYGPWCNETIGLDGRGLEVCRVQSC